MKDHPRISYRVVPSFDESQRLEIEMNWDMSSETYKAHIIHGFGHQEILVPKKSVPSLLERIEGLRLPPISDGMKGLDGTLHEISIGSSTAFSLRWWEDLPKNWQEMAPIVQMILDMTKV